eukprot:TRINITY_DN3141_c0_g1_i2.p2 TRINITY_DN3141_c0_g1~~TRINITY_DN3141_c0_g1_i2.p2  ORF type:complete len:149 (-),score=13.08 TRINITY_DN3141_c0_g1_i2:203-649(-)
MLEGDPWQVSMNAYEAGDFMVPHKDGAGVCGLILALGSPLLLDFYYRPTQVPVKATQVFSKKSGEGSAGYAAYEVAEAPTVSVLMEPGGMLVLTGEAFVQYAHGIAKRTSDVITEKVINLPLLQEKTQCGQTMQRGNRISIVMWDIER